MGPKTGETRFQDLAIVEGGRILYVIETPPWGRGRRVSPENQSDSITSLLILTNGFRIT